MPSYSSSTPTIVYKQATQPSLEAGAFWYDTSTTDIYFCDGSSYKKISSGADAAGYETKLLQVALEVLRLTANASIANPDYDSMFCDICSDTTGTDNTIDTGNTTASFSTNKYTNGGAETITGQTLDTNGGGENNSGLKIECLINGTISSITKNAYSNPTAVEVRETPTGAAIANGTASFSGNTATFSTPPSLTTTQQYYYLIGTGQSQSKLKNSGTSYPSAGTASRIVNGCYNGSDNAAAHHFESYVANANASNKVVRTNAQALSFAPAYVMLYAKNTIAGTGTITFDVSFDGASTWDSTGNALNTKIAVSDGSSKNMILKINLNGTGAGNTANIENYAAIIWSS